MSLSKTLFNLKNDGFNPLRILDIGCYKGNWTREVKNIYPNSQYYLIDGIYYPEIELVNEPYNIVVLNDTKTDIEWYEKKNTGDSMFKENTIHFSDCAPVIKQTDTLDNLFPNDTFDFIKIDCQGAEIPILKGGQKLVSNAEVILLEIPFVGEYNKSVPDFKTHIIFMDNIGFVPYDICELHYLNKYLIQIDVIFVKKSSQLLIKVQNYIESK